MKKKLLFSGPGETVNKIKKLLNESKDMVLDNDLLGSFEEMCENLESQLKNAKVETANLSVKNKENKESKILEKQIQEEREIFNNIMEVIGAGLCLIDKDSKIIWANDTLNDWLNLEESPVGSHCSGIYHCNVVGTDKCPATQVRKGKESHIIESWITTKTKKRMCIQHIAIPIAGKDGEVENILLLTVDVTESEKLVHRLLLLQQFGEVTQGTLHLDKLLHLILTCITADYSFGFNRAMLFLINKELNVLNGKLAIGPSSTEEATRIWKEMSSRHNSLLDIVDNLDYSHNIDTPLNTMTKLMVYSLADADEVVTICTKEKKPVIVKDAAKDTRVSDEFRKALGVNEFVCVPLIAKNEPIGVIVADNAYTAEPISEDRINTLTMFVNQASLAIENAETYKSLEDKINQLTETQQRLIRSEKLAAIGSMSSYVAHEIRNPLVTIGGFAKTLSRFTFTNSKIKANIDIIIEEVKRLEKILNNITDFSKPSKPEKVDTQVCVIMENTCMLLENYFQEKHIKLQKRYETGIPEIPVDPAQIKQVFLNILMNAVESMPDGGALDVNIESEKKSIKIYIRDTGKGIQSGVLQNIYDPFFTTKESGTGVGLSVSLKIIEDHGGTIDAISKHGKGTTMVLTLPKK
ncbi:two-component sensor kinase [Candidatus Scalindua japonica]|uniref:histidine kinase n=1 Tax=Candidatus Scalindua japonica TaxID=1284222 RepID=A0A286TXB3_9BACT|nr:ATP-binding protein [Candidatus Scalindua japonica]GAX60528.1 two-component sensor kinase [Candidatus Scalindua japonica]